MDALKSIEKLIFNGEIPFCENLIKNVVAIFLDNNLTHRNVKLASYKVLVQLSSYFDVLETLYMEDEVTIAQDMLASVISDS